MKILASLALIGAIMTIGPDGMEIGSYSPSTGNYMTVGPEGMKLGTIDPKTGNLFELSPRGMKLGTVGKDLESEPSKTPWDRNSLD